jgi:hypothetical protein
MGKARARGQSKLAPENWTHIYIFLAIALTVGGTIISLLPLEWYWRLPLYTLVGLLTAYLFLGNRRSRESWAH